jgi:hypothetical protein
MPGSGLDLLFREVKILAFDAHKCKPVDRSQNALGSW